LWYTGFFAKATGPWLSLNMVIIHFELTCRNVRASRPNQSASFVASNTATYSASVVLVAVQSCSFCYDDGYDDSETGHNDSETGHNDSETGNLMIINWCCSPWLNQGELFYLYKEACKHVVCMRYHVSCAWSMLACIRCNACPSHTCHVLCCACMSCDLSMTSAPLFSVVEGWKDDWLPRGIHGRRYGCGNAMGGRVDMPQDWCARRYGKDLILYNLALNTDEWS
jgi:hypothetical protein